MYLTYSKKPGSLFGEAWYLWQEEAGRKPKVVESMAVEEVKANTTDHDPRGKQRKATRACSAVAGLPFFMVMALASFISLLARHFMQYASTAHLLSVRPVPFVPTVYDWCPGMSSCGKIRFTMFGLERDN